nr:unnamed protein product [Digitaria exilis]
MGSSLAAPCELALEVVAPLLEDAALAVPLYAARIEQLPSKGHDCLESGVATFELSRDSLELSPNSAQIYRCCRQIRPPMLPTKLQRGRKSRRRPRTPSSSACRSSPGFPKLPSIFDSSKSTALTSALPRRRAGRRSHEPQARRTHRDRAHEGARTPKSHRVRAMAEKGWARTAGEVELGCRP